MRADRWQDLSVDECLALLPAGRVGRSPSSRAPSRRINAADVPANWWGQGRPGGRSPPGRSTRHTGGVHSSCAADAGTTRIFLLDDHEVVRRGVRDLLDQEADLTGVGESGSAEEAKRRLPALRPDVAILDVRLGDGSGIDVCRQVRSQDPSITALMLTTYDDHDALFAAILAGAAGYLLKQIRGTDLVDAVRRVAAGQSLLDPTVTTPVLRRLRNGPDLAGKLPGLTEQERRVLGLIAEGLTNRQIAQRMHLAEKTIKNYVSSLLAKLNLERRTQAAVLGARLLDG